MEAAVKALKMGESADVYNIAAKLVKAGGDAMIDTLTSVCNTILKTGEWSTEWTKPLVITLLEKAVLKLQKHQPQLCHLSRVMLKIILSRLQSQAEKVIAEEQAGFRG